MRGARHHTLAFKPYDRLTRWAAAHPEAQGNFILADRCAGGDIANHDCLNDPLEDLVGQRLAGDCNPCHQSTVYS